MKSLTRSLLVTAVVAAASLSLVSAQTPPPAPAPAPAPAPGAPPADPAAHLQAGVDHHTAHLTKELGLTDAQQAQVKAIYQSDVDQTLPIMQDKSLAKEDKHAQIKAIHDATKAKLEAVLTPDQKTKFDALAAKHEQEMKDREAGGAPKQS